MNAETKQGRAPRMAPEERREQILDAAVPLLLEHGVEVTTRQIADAAGIAEGTVFRAFADKEALVDAAIERVMDPAEILAALGDIDPAAPLEDKIRGIVTLLHARVAGVVRFMSALGPRDHARHRARGKGGDGHPAHRPPLGEASGVVELLLEPDAPRLRVPVATAVEYLRILVFGTAMPFLSNGGSSDPAQLADFILRGIAKEGD